MSSGLEATNEAVAAETESKRANVLRGLKEVVQTVCQDFDNELERHQGRMSKRVFDVKRTLNDKCGTIRVAASLEVRDAQALNRALALEAVRHHESVASSKVEEEVQQVHDHVSSVEAEVKELKQKLDRKTDLLEHARLEAPRPETKAKLS